MECYDPDGKVISADEWGRMSRLREYKRVDFTELPVKGGLVISTVWIGLDHRFGYPDHGLPPIIFETMIFTSKAWNHEDGELMLDQGCWRWSTKENAQRGHNQVVAFLLDEGPEPEGE